MADFAVTVGGSSVTPASGNFSGTNSSADKWLSLTLPSAISVGDTVAVTYTPTQGTASVNLMTAAIPAVPGGAVASSGGNSGQHWQSTGIVQNGDGSVVTLQFPTDTLAATQPF